MRASREAWAKRVEGWKRSKQTAAQFAAEQRINASSLSWWKWRLGKEKGKEGAGRSAARPRGKRSVSKTFSPLTFVEVAAPARRETLEIVLASGVRIRVPADFDATALGRLLGLLEALR